MLWVSTHKYFFPSFSWLSVSFNPKFQWQKLIREFFALFFLKFCFEFQLTSTFFRHFPDYSCHTPQISMTEINQGIFCTLFIFPNFKISKNPIIFCHWQRGNLTKLMLAPPAGSLAENDGKKYLWVGTQIMLL